MKNKLKTKKEEVTIEVPIKVGEAFYQVYNDGQEDWCNCRFGVDKFIVKSILIEEDKITVQSNREGSWFGNLEFLKEKIKYRTPAQAAKALNDLLVEEYKKSNPKPVKETVKS
jgi:hypothetical protein